VNQKSRGNTYYSVGLEITDKGKRKEENQKRQESQKADLSKPGNNQIDK
jgi:hypothetical protein